MGQKRPAYQKAKAASSYATAASWTNVTGLSITVETSGWYRVLAEFTQEINTATEGATFRLAKGGVRLDEPQLSYVVDATEYMAIHIEAPLAKLDAGDVITLQAQYSSSSSNVFYNADTAIPSLTIIGY